METWYTIIKLINMEVIYFLCFCVSESAVTDLILPPWSAKLMMNFFCSVFPVNMHPIQNCSEALARSGPDDSCTLACFQIGSVWPKPDTVCQNPIGSGPVLHNIIWAVCTVEECNWVWKWETGSRPVAFCKKLGLMILAHQLASEQDAFAQYLTRSSRLDPDPDQFCTIWFWPSLEKWNWIGIWMWEVRSSIYDPAWFWLHAGCNGHNWPWPKYFWIRSGLFIGFRNPQTEISVSIFRCSPHPVSSAVPGDTATPWAVQTERPMTRQPHLSHHPSLLCENWTMTLLPETER